MTNRMDKVNELIHRELGELFIKEVEFAPDVFVTITRVAVASDLKSAKVWVSIFPENQKMQTLRLLEKRSRYLQGQLRKKLSIKYIPNLNFVLDRTEEEASKIENLLDSV